MTITAAEYQARHDRIRKEMRRQGLEILIVAGRDDIYSRGNLRYITDYAGAGYLMFPVEGKPVLFVHPVQAASPKPGQRGALLDFVSLQRYADGAYGDPVLDVMQELRHRGITTGIGFVGTREIAAPVYQAVSEYATEPVRDATNILREARLIKTPEMIARMRDSARLADEAYGILTEIAKPGVSDYELYAAVKQHLFLNGSEYSLEVIDAAGAKMNFTWAPTGEVLQDGGTLFMEITPAVGGVYGQLPFCLPIGTPPEKLLDLRAAWLEGFTIGESMLKPGTKVSELSRAMKESINGRGYLTPFAQGHAIGLDVVDGWAIGDESNIALQTGMTLALHPAAVEELGGDAFTGGYTYLITDTGAERLSSLDFSN